MKSQKNYKNSENRAATPLKKQATRLKFFSGSKRKSALTLETM